MSTTVSRLGTYSRSSKRDKSGMSQCWQGESLCAGDVLAQEHGARLTWWLTGIFVIIALILDITIMNHANDTATTGPWSQLSSRSWLQPTPRALGSIVGIAIVMDAYVSYMMAIAKGHLDKYPGQYVMGLFIRLALYIFFLYGVSYGGFIGSMLALITLGLSLVWSILTGHSCSPIHAWLNILELAFVFIMGLWLGLSGVTVWPSK